QLQILDAVAEHTRRHAVVTLAVLHDLNLATRYGDEILMLKDGRLEEIGSVSAVVQPATIAAIYGVDCCILRVPDTEFSAIYPLALTP
ncbi:MAG: ABC transporter ATP-binding protein, partial [Methylobacterium sp.]